MCLWRILAFISTWFVRESSFRWTSSSAWAGRKWRALCWEQSFSLGVISHTGSLAGSWQGCESQALPRHRSISVSQVSDSKSGNIKNVTAIWYGSVSFSNTWSTFSKQWKKQIVEEFILIQNDFTLIFYFSNRIEKLYMSQKPQEISAQISYTLTTKLFLDMYGLLSENHKMYCNW